MAAGRIALAHGRLSDLGRWWPGQPEVEYRLGESELARGRPGEALAAWARVPSGSAFAAKAAEKRATLLINTGRYSPAEAVLEDALRRPASAAEREAQRRAMNRLLRFEGRIDDLRRLLLASWPEVPDPAGVLKELWLLDNSPVPVESWGRTLRAADPEDDRVWLGLANEAILTGRFAEAARLLDKLPATPARRPGRLACPAGPGRGDRRRPGRLGRDGPPAGLGTLGAAGRSRCAPGSPPGGATARPNAGG